MTPNEQQRTAADGYVYSFKLELVDYILPERVLPMANFSAPEAPPPALTAALRLPLADGLVTWDLAILNYNKALWARRANRKIGDAVTTLDDAAALAMREPVYVVTNKTQWLPEQRVNGTTFGGERQPRLYYSLSDFYHPSAVSKINEFGLPYEYSPSINTEVRCVATGAPEVFCALYNCHKHSISTEVRRVVRGAQRCPVRCTIATSTATTPRCAAWPEVPCTLYDCHTHRVKTRSTLRQNDLPQARRLYPALPVGPHSQAPNHRTPRRRRTSSRRTSATWSSRSRTP